MVEVKADDRARKRPCGGRRCHGAGWRLRIGAGTAAWLIAAATQAQSNACDQLRRSLAERLPGDSRSYSLEAVPSGTPLPPGGKFIGNCEGGARKILYRRGAVAQLASAPAAAPPAAATPPKREVLPDPARRPTDPNVAVAVAINPNESTGVPVLQPPDTKPPSQAVAWRQSTAGFATGHWPWLLALAMMPLAWSAWAWWSYRRAYDAAGLPRGPRL